MNIERGIPGVVRRNREIGMTRIPTGEIVAEVPNPGRVVVAMGGRIFVEEDGQLKPASNEAIQKARKILFEAEKAKKESDIIQP